MTAWFRLPQARVFDADGNELVHEGHLTDRYGGPRKSRLDIRAAAPPPVARVGSELLWRRCDIEPLTLFIEEGTHV